MKPAIENLKAQLCKPPVTPLGALAVAIPFQTLDSTARHTCTTSTKAKAEPVNPRLKSANTVRPISVH